MICGEHLMPCCAEKSPGCQQGQKAEHTSLAGEIMPVWDSPRFSPLITPLSRKCVSAAVQENRKLFGKTRRTLTRSSVLCSGVTFSLFSSIPASYSKCKALLALRIFFRFNKATNSVHSANPGWFTKTVFVCVCVLAGLWRQGAAAFRACPCLTVTWRSWMETPCVYLDWEPWRRWKGAGEFRPLVLSL